jgi:hypothetical protein
MHAQHRVVEVLEHGPDPLQKGLAHGAGTHRAGGPFEQPGADPFFQALDPPAQRWRGQVQLMGRLPEAAQVGHGDEGTQLVEIKPLLFMHRWYRTLQ